MLADSGVSSKAKDELCQGFTKLAKNVAKFKDFDPMSFQTYNMNSNFDGSGMGINANTTNQPNAVDQIRDAVGGISNKLDQSLNQDLAKSSTLCAFAAAFNNMASKIMNVFGKKDMAQNFANKADQYAKQAETLGKNAKIMDQIRQDIGGGFGEIVQERRQQQAAMKVQRLVRKMQAKQRGHNTKGTLASGKGKGKAAGMSM